MAGDGEIDALAHDLIHGGAHALESTGDVVEAVVAGAAAAGKVTPGVAALELFDASVNGGHVGHAEGGHEVGGALVFADVVVADAVELAAGGVGLAGASELDLRVDASLVFEGAGETDLAILLPEMVSAGAVFAQSLAHGRGAGALDTMGLIDTVRVDKAVTTIGHLGSAEARGVVTVETIGTFEGVAAGLAQSGALADAALAGKPREALVAGDALVVGKHDGLAGAVEADGAGGADDEAVVAGVALGAEVVVGALAGLAGQPQGAAVLGAGRGGRHCEGDEVALAAFSQRLAV